MPEEKVTEEEATEEKTGEVKVDSGKLVGLHGLLAECTKLARETVEAEFFLLADDPKMRDTIAKMSCDLAIALFHKASVPDQTETMLAALERGLEWYSAREEEQKAESAKISADFQKSIHEIVPPRMMTPLESLVRSLLDFAGRYSEVELSELFRKSREVPETESGGQPPTPKE